MTLLLDLALLLKQYGDHSQPLENTSKHEPDNHNFLANSRTSLNQADDAAACMQRLREKDRQNRIKHLRRDIGKQAGECQKNGIPMNSSEVARSCYRFNHGPGFV